MLLEKKKGSRQGLTVVIRCRVLGPGIKELAQVNWIIARRQRRTHVDALVRRIYSSRLDVVVESATDEIQKLC